MPYPNAGRHFIHASVFCIGLAIGVSFSVLRVPKNIGASPSINVPAASNDSATSSKKPKLNRIPNRAPSPNDPTDEELAVIKSLGEKHSKGKYILSKDNPHATRMKNQFVESELLSLEPAIVSRRREFLKSSNVSEDVINSITDHAVAIADASVTAELAIQDM